MLLADSILEGSKKFDERLTLEEMKQMLRIKGRIRKTEVKKRPRTRASKKAPPSNSINRTRRRDILDVLNNLSDNEYSEELDIMDVEEAST